MRTTIDGQGEPYAPLNMRVRIDPVVQSQPVAGKEGAGGGKRDTTHEQSVRLGILLKRVKQDRGFTSDEALAAAVLKQEKMKVGQSTLNRLINGKSDISIGAAVVLCRFVGAQPSEIGLQGFDHEFSAIQPALTEPLEKLFGWFYGSRALQEAFKQRAGDYTVEDLLTLRAAQRLDTASLDAETAERVHELVAENRAKTIAKTGEDLPDETAAKRVEDSLVPPPKPRKPRGTPGKPR